MSQEASVSEGRAGENEMDPFLDPAQALAKGGCRQKPKEPFLSGSLRCREHPPPPPPPF